MSAGRLLCAETEDALLNLQILYYLYSYVLYAARLAQGIYCRNSAHLKNAILPFTVIIYITIFAKIVSKHKRFDPDIQLLLILRPIYRVPFTQ